MAKVDSMGLGGADWRSCVDPSWLLGLLGQLECTVNTLVREEGETAMQQTLTVRAVKTKPERPRGCNNQQVVDCCSYGSVCVPKDYLEGVSKGIRVRPDEVRKSGWSQTA